MIYNVIVQETWTQTYQVEADSEEQAKARLQKSLEGEPIKEVSMLEAAFEFVETGDPENWQLIAQP